ncbi:hypothetical protein APV28_3427 [Comamonas testosteroni]|nr:hypothetical protein APV28_3427 [Comamonas testosteroni]
MGPGRFLVGSLQRQRGLLASIGKVHIAGLGSLEDGPVKLALGIFRLGQIGVVALIFALQIGGGGAVLAELGCARDDASRAPAVFRIDDERKTRLLVVEQVLVPGEAVVLILTQTTPAAPLKAHDLPFQAIERAFAAQRDQRLDLSALLGIAQLRPHALGHVDQAAATGAAQGLGGVKAHGHHGTALGTVEVATLGFLLGAAAQSLHLQSLQRHGSPQAEGRCLVAEVDGEDLVLVAAQLHQLETLAQLGQLGQLALGRHQLRILNAGDGEGFSAGLELAAHAPFALLELFHVPARRLPVHGKDKAAVVLAEPGQLAVAERSHPFRPVAGRAFVLRAAHDGKGLGLAVALDHARGTQLQRAVVLEHLGHGANALERLAIA